MELQNDPYHLNKKLGGSAAAAAEEQSLRSRIAVAEAAAETARREAAVAGEKIDLPGLIETTTDGQLPMGEMISAVDDLRALNDICIGEAINGVREHAAIIAEAKALFEAPMADSEWVRKLNAGDPATGVRPRHRTGPAVCIAHVGERAGPPGASTP